MVHNIVKYTLVVLGVFISYKLWADERYVGAVILTIMVLSIIFTIFKKELY
jgi:hypothetical protein